VVTVQNHREQVTNLVSDQCSS